MLTISIKHIFIARQAFDGIIVHYSLAKLIDKTRYQ